MEPVFKEEALTLGHLLVACRLVFESCMACEPLPVPLNGHKTFDVIDLNRFIVGRKEKVLKFYRQLFFSVSTDQIKEPDFDHIRREILANHYPPRELIETWLMRVQDYAMMLKLVLFDLQKEKSFL